MAKVLYITANPKSEDQSYSLRVGREFIENYMKSHPQDTVTELNLYRENIPLIDYDVFTGWGILQKGGDFKSLTPQQQAKIGRMSEIVDQFVEHDKYIFVTPTWNFGFPPMVKAYLDAIVVAGKTFRFTEAGSIGLLQNKKLLHINASGGTFSEGPLAHLDYNVRYLHDLVGFMGITDYSRLWIEGIAKDPSKADEILAPVMAEARAKALAF